MRQLRIARAAWLSGKRAVSISLAELDRSPIAKRQVSGVLASKRLFKYSSSQDRLFTVINWMVTGERIVDLSKMLKQGLSCIADEINARLVLLSVLLYNNYVKWPTSNDGQSLMRNALYSTPFRGMVGIVDGTESAVRRPHDLIQHRSVQYALSSSSYSPMDV